jgi:hypothetical protein
MEGFADDYQGLTIKEEAQCSCQSRFKAKSMV